MTSRVRISARSRPSLPLYPHFNWHSGFWPCVKFCLVGGNDKLTLYFSLSCWKDSVLLSVVKAVSLFFLRLFQFRFFLQHFLDSQNLDVTLWDSLSLDFFPIIYVTILSFVISVKDERSIKLLPVVPATLYIFNIAEGNHIYQPLCSGRIRHKVNF